MIPIASASRQMAKTMIAGNSRRHSGNGSRGALQKPLYIAFHSQNSFFLVIIMPVNVVEAFLCPCRRNIVLLVTAIKS